MNSSRSLAVLALAALAAPFAHAQVLSDFGSFHDPDHAFFSGDWASGGAPLASFSQGAGFYEIKGGTNNANSSVERYFGSGGDYVNLSITGDYLTVSARLLDGNQASSFTVFLVDESSMNQASATFLASDFSAAGFTSVSGLLAATPGFNSAAVASFIITGGVTGGAAAFNIAFDHLEVTTSAVPEPSAFALGAGAATLFAAFFRRRRRA